MFQSKVVKGRKIYTIELTQTDAQHLAQVRRGLGLIDQAKAFRAALQIAAAAIQAGQSSPTLMGGDKPGVGREGAAT